MNTRHGGFHRSRIVQFPWINSNLSIIRVVFPKVIVVELKAACRVLWRTCYQGGCQGDEVNIKGPRGNSQIADPYTLASSSSPALTSDFGSPSFR